MRRCLALCALVLAACTPASPVTTRDSRTMDHGPWSVASTTVETTTEPPTTTTTEPPTTTTEATTTSTTRPRPVTTVTTVTTVAAVAAVERPAGTYGSADLAACIRHYESTDGVDPNLYQFEGGTWSAAFDAAVAQGLIPKGTPYTSASAAERWVQDAAFAAWVNLGYLHSAWAAQRGRCF